MRCLDSRRLTGPNLLWDCPGAVIDVEFDNGNDDTGYPETGCPGYGK